MKLNSQSFPLIIHLPHIQQRCPSLCAHMSKKHTCVLPQLPGSTVKNCDRVRWGEVRMKKAKHCYDNVGAHRHTGITKTVHKRLAYVFTRSELVQFSHQHCAQFASYENF